MPTQLPTRFSADTWWRLMGVQSELRTDGGERRGRGRWERQ